MQIGAVETTNGSTLILTGDDTYLHSYGVNAVGWHNDGALYIEDGAHFGAYMQSNPTNDGFDLGGFHNGGFSDGVGITLVTGSGSLLGDQAQATIGYNHEGTLELLSGGQAQIGTNLSATEAALYDGKLSGSTGTVEIYAGCDLTSGGHIFVGYDGGSTGHLLINGSEANLTSKGALTVGLGGDGDASLAGGGTALIGVSLSTSDLALYLGREGDSSGTLAIYEGSSITLDGGLVAGQYAGSSGTLLVDGTGADLSGAGAASIGYSGTGTLTIDDGASVSLGTGLSASSPSLVDGAAADGDGTITVSAGSSLTAGTGIILGEQAGSDGSLTITGAGSTLTADGYGIVGDLGHGTLIVGSGGKVTFGASVTTGAALAIGNQAGATGVVKLSGRAEVTVGGELAMAPAAGSHATISIEGTKTTLSADSLVMGGTGSSTEGKATFTIGSGASLMIADFQWRCGQSQIRRQLHPIRFHLRHG